jgi:threonine aldolase
VIDEICDEAHALGVKVHIDGARLFNAAEASGKTVREIVAKADTVTFCLSKALGAPAGSMVAGPKALMDKARLYRKRLGGGMRQAGVLAATGLIALNDHPAKLAADHSHACALAHALAAIPGISIDPATVESNIVIFDVSALALKPSAISARLKAEGILMNAINDRQMRAVTHYDVTGEDCMTAVAALRRICATS